MNDLTIIPDQKAPADIEQSLATINAPLSDFLQHVGLPTDNLLSPVNERRKIIQAFETVLEVLPADARKQATYISKSLSTISMDCRPVSGHSLPTIFG
jgi:hypothetical protein